MARRVSPRPAEFELEVLNVLWREGPSTVRKIHEFLQADGRETGLTTTLKTMQIMVDKGFLVCSDGRPRVYSAAAPAEQTQASLLKNFVETVFDGSVRKLLLRAVQDVALSKAELEEIRRTIDGKRSTNKKGTAK